MNVLENNIFNNIESLMIVKNYMEDIFERAKTSTEDLGTLYHKSLEAIIEYEPIETRHALALANHFLNLKIQQLLEFTDDDGNIKPEEEIYQDLVQVNHLIQLSNHLEKKYLLVGLNNLYTDNKVLFHGFSGSVFDRIVYLATILPAEAVPSLARYEKIIERLLVNVDSYDFLLNQQSYGQIYRFALVDLFKGDINKTIHSYQNIKKIDSNNREYLIELLIKNNLLLINEKTYDALIMKNNRFSPDKKMTLNKHLIDEYIAFREEQKRNNENEDTPICRKLSRFFNYLIKEQMKLSEIVIENFKDKQEIQTIIGKYVREDLENQIANPNFKTTLCHWCDVVKTWFKAPLQEIRITIRRYHHR